MVKLEFVSESEHITRKIECLLIAKELYNELQFVLKEALNYRFPERYTSRDEIGNITHIRIATDKGFSTEFEVRIRNDEEIV